MRTEELDTANRELLLWNGRDECVTCVRTANSDNVDASGKLLNKSVPVVRQFGSRGLC